MAKPLVAIVGRPNVGKSMLFNKLVGRRLSIVEDTPGVTRDRLYAECEWRGRTFDMVDTGGIEPGTDHRDPLTSCVSRRRSPSRTADGHRLRVRHQDGPHGCGPGRGQHAPALPEAGRSGGEQDGPGGHDQPGYL